MESILSHGRRRALLAKKSRRHLRKKARCGGHQGHGQYRARIGNEPIDCSGRPLLCRGKTKEQPTPPFVWGMHSHVCIEAAAGMCHRIYVIELPSAVGYICARVCTYRCIHTYTHPHIRVYTDVCKMTANLVRVPPVLTFGCVRANLSGNIPRHFRHCGSRQVPAKFFPNAMGNYGILSQVFHASPVSLNRPTIFFPGKFAWFLFLTSTRR